MSAHVNGSPHRLIDGNRGGSNFQGWTLDSLGNWAGFTDQGTSQTRTHDAANEITAIASSPDWIDPACDEAGNMTSGPKTGEEGTRLHSAYKARRGRL